MAVIKGLCAAYHGIHGILCALNFVGSSVVISLEQSSYSVSETSGFVEVCVVFEGLGVEDGVVTVDVSTQMITATGKATTDTSDTVGLHWIVRI